jgi:hypothetical protein
LIAIRGKQEVKNIAIICHCNIGNYLGAGPALLFLSLLFLIPPRLAGTDGELAVCIVPYNNELSLHH